MDTEVINISRDKIKSAAADYFEAICGFNRDREKYASMFQQGLRVREEIFSGVGLQAVVRRFSAEGLSGADLILGEVKFKCTAFERLSQESVVAIYAFIISGKGFELEQGPLMEQFYADTWGTAYIDAGRDELRALLGLRHDASLKATETKPGNLFITDSFGPGYYGMSTDQIKLFFEILDSKQIGVELAGDSVMLPLKSCAGFFVITDGNSAIPGSDCRSCSAEASGCNFCRARNQESCGVDH
jgi:hypothetical protein